MVIPTPFQQPADKQDKSGEDCAADGNAEEGLKHVFAP